MTMAPDRTFSLDDRYNAVTGEVLVTGIQALVRLPFDQMRADRARGWKTGAFVSGYQGSPLGGFDRELVSHKSMLDELGITHWPGQNEELAATAVAGSQLVATVKTARVQGVAGYWYGKAPGLDRASDAIRHANYVGTAPHGGVLALIGDDPACKSSTLPSRSDASIAAMGFPLLDAGTMQDLLDLGRHGIEMSRAAGLWTGLKIVTSVADGSGLARIDPDRLAFRIPTIERDGQQWKPMLSGSTTAPVSLKQEIEVLGPRIEMALRYVEENALNQTVIDSPSAWLGIVASGYVAECVLKALAILGLDETAAADLGIRMLKLRAIHPFDARSIRTLARGVGTVLVVEEKLPFLETLVRDALYSTPDRPAVLGKRDAADTDLVGSTGALSPEALVEPLRRVLRTNISDERLAPVRHKPKISLTVRDDAVRTPYFCSGCPHNTSTLVPEGAWVGMGIGCHGMVRGIGRPDRGELISVTQMGGEGTHWIGMSPFVETPHLFQNIGDGTFFHSGQLALQSAVSAGVNVTFKILYNGAVAMTGGQDATAALPVPQLAAKLLAEGVKQVIVTTDEPEKYKGVHLGDGVSVRHRDDIIAVQEHLRTVAGVTVLIHDQQCAAEKRRDRKRGLLPTPKTRVVIDHRICEGCGDCGIQSNCLSLEPFDTDFGRKTRIDQASCNLDRSCIKGDCPAFVSVVPAKGQHDRDNTAHTNGPSTALPDPTVIVPVDGTTIRMPGIGGTGVVTVSQLLLTAAKIDGRNASAVDQTGLSQKAGPVVSTLAIGEPAAGQVHVLIGFDILTSCTPANLDGLDPAVSHVVASTTLTPTGRMVGNVAGSRLDLAPYRSELDGRSAAPTNRYLDASRLTTGLLGSAVTANVLLMGVAFQSGLIPLSASSIDRAIELNGAAVDSNRRAFAWGRQWVVDPAGVEAVAFGSAQEQYDRSGLDAFADNELMEIVARSRHELRAFQSDSYAKRYVDLTRRCLDGERAAGSDGAFTRTVARQLYRVMAYKDEYEVARLLLDGKDRLASALGGPIESATWHLHPPMLRGAGINKKLRLGPWARPVMGALTSMKRLRGTPLDPFGRTEVRKAERQLVRDYTALVESLIPLLSTDAPRAARIAGMVEQVRGFEDVKLRNLAAYQKAVGDATAPAHRH